MARLSELVARFGDELAEDAERCEPLLAQACSGDFSRFFLALTVILKCATSLRRMLLPQNIGAPREGRPD